MHILVDRRDWRVGYYRGPQHHHLCLLPCLTLRVRRRVGSDPPPLMEGGSTSPITIDELVADAQLAVADTDWADPAEALSTQNYLAQLQQSLPVSHQLSMCRIGGFDVPVLAIGAPDGSWTVCAIGVGSVHSPDLARAGVAAWALLQTSARDRTKP